jgi:hypothetical protein
MELQGLHASWCEGTKVREIPTFASYDAYCADLQTAILHDYQELAYEFASDKKGLRIISRRIAELEKSIAALLRNGMVK